MWFNSPKLFPGWLYSLPFPGFLLCPVLPFQSPPHPLDSSLQDSKGHIRYICTPACGRQNTDRDQSDKGLRLESSSLKQCSLQHNFSFHFLKHMFEEPSSAYKTDLGATTPTKVWSSAFPGLHPASHCIAAAKS